MRAGRLPDRSNRLTTSSPLDSTSSRSSSPAVASAGCETGDGARNRTEGDTGRIASLGGLVLSNRGILAGRREFRRFFHLGSLGCHGRSCCRGSHPLLLKPLAFFPLGSLGSAPGLAGLLLGYPPLLAGLGLGGAQTLLLRSRFGAQALLLGQQELLGLAGLLLLLHLRKLLLELLLLAVAAPQLLLRRSHGVAAGAWHVLLVDARDLGKCPRLGGPPAERNPSRPAARPDRSGTSGPVGHWIVRSAHRGPRRHI